MNTWKFMDKQIMDLSSSQNNFEGKDDCIDLVNHPRQGGGDGDITEEILPNYDFQPICSHASLQHSNADINNAAGITAKSSTESKANAGTTDYGYIDSIQPANLNIKNDSDVYTTALISEIDRTMKKHADNLMDVLEGVGARLQVLENKSRQLENSAEDLKASFANNHGSTDGKLRQIENIIREVQAGVQVVKDKHETMEAQLQLSKAEPPPETQISGHIDHQPAASAPLQSYHQLPPQHYQPLPPPPQQQPPQPPQVAATPPPPSQPQPQPPQPQYQPSSHLQFSLPPPYGNPSLLYAPPPSQLSSQISGQYYGGGPPVKSQQHSSSNMNPSGYPQVVPTTKILPHAVHTGSGLGGGSGSNPSSSNSSNRVPIDDVVDKVTSMGFTRDQVRLTVRKLTENGQAVDLNVVLDKLMTDGVENHGPKPWFGR